MFVIIVLNPHQNKESNTKHLNKWEEVLIFNNLFFLI